MSSLNANGLAGYCKQAVGQFKNLGRLALGMGGFGHHGMSSQVVARAGRRGLEAAKCGHDFGTATELCPWCSTEMSVGKRKKTQSKQTKPSKADWVKYVLGEWADEAGKNDCDPLKINDAPEWVLNAYIECAKIVIPGGLPPVEKWDAEFLGVFLGRLNGLERFYAGEVPLGPETQAEVDKVRAMVEGRPLPKNLKAIQKDFETSFDATREAIPIATAMAGASTYADARDFQKGLMRGIEIKPEDMATSRTFQRHTRTFWVLALFWRFWVKCRSVREIWQHLCNAVGERKIGSFKTFETHVAKKIGLKVRGRGRPRTAK